MYFRRFVQEHALRLGASGFAANLPDGSSVLVEAEGQREALEELVRLLRKGPSGAIVHGVDVEWRAPSGRFDGFDIR